MKLVKSFKLKKAFFVFGILVLMIVSFNVGLIISGRSDFFKEIASEEAVFVGKIIGEYSEPEPGKIGQDINFALFWKTWDLVHDNYVDQDKVEDKKLFYGALQGLVSSLGDPYTVFMNPKDSKDFGEDLSGEFEGIGAEISIKDEILTIIAPLPGMPAEKSGLKAGDKIYAINDESTAGITIDEAVEKIRGPKGTQVKLSIARDGFSELKDYELTRNTIVVKSVQTELRDDNIFYIKITSFNENTKPLFDKAVGEIVKDGPRGIIVDLRNNPGGYLNTAIEVVSEWVEEGVVVFEKFGDDKSLEHPARGRALLKDFPTVVLVNEGSASASEILAGALQDYQKATLVGKKTFGKGSVQTLINLDDGSSVKITIAKWLTPSGRSINDEGIVPDIEVDYTEEDFENDLDPQLDKAVEILNEK